MADSTPIKASHLELEFLCSNKWQDMAGDEGMRNCKQCSCNLERIDNYSAVQMQELQNRIDGGEKICVAFTASVAVKYLAKSSKTFPIAFTASSVSILLALSLNLSGCAVHDASSKISESTKKAIEEGVTYNPGKAQDAGVLKVGRPAKSFDPLDRKIKNSSKQNSN